MAVLRKALASTITMLAVSVAAGGLLALTPLLVHAQDDANSRLLPTPPAGQISPPVPIIAEGPPRRAPANETPEFVSVETIVENVARCRNIVSPTFQVDTSSLWASGWGHTQPRQGMMGGRQFESIQYLKDGLTLALLDFGDFVMCRVGGMVDDDGAMEKLRSQISTDYSAKPMAEQPGLQALTDDIRGAMPHIDTQDLLVTGAYQIELASHTVTADQHGQEGIGDLGVLMVTINPLPSNFQNYASAKAE